MLACWLNNLLYCSIDGCESLLAAGLAKTTVLDGDLLRCNVSKTRIETTFLEIKDSRSIKLNTRETSRDNSLEEGLSSLGWTSKHKLALSPLSQEWADHPIVSNIPPWHIDENLHP